MLSDSPEPATTHSFSGSNSLIWKNKTLGVTEKRHFQHFTYNFNSNKQVNIFQTNLSVKLLKLIHAL